MAREGARVWGARGTPVRVSASRLTASILVAVLSGCSLGGTDVADRRSQSGADSDAESAAMAGEAAAPDLEEAAGTIDAEDMQARIDFLASDALQGRATPSRGLEVAAAYLASEFAALGLEPAGDDGSYLQRFPIPAPPGSGASSIETAPPEETARREDQDVDETGEADSAATVPDSSLALAPNVVAVFPGSDPSLRDTYVVFSAHVDHLGVGEPDATGDSIYNGADDDASGTSALVEIAEAFSVLGAAWRPARSVVFLGVSGEERGLLGSEWFTDHPTIPLENVVANVNMDMIARNAPDTIVVIGQEYSSLGPLVRSVAEERADELGLTVIRDPWPEERFFFRSDHYHFARREIPALFFFAGVHEDYHQPSDEPETIDAEKAARVARLAFFTAHAIASDRETPAWTEEGLAEVRRMVTGGR